MRKVEGQQMQFGEVDIGTIVFDLRSHDEIPKLLMGLQHIYCTPELREMLGRGFFNSTTKYALQTLKDNVSLLTLEVLDKINEGNCGVVIPLCY